MQKSWNENDYLGMLWLTMQMLICTYKGFLVVDISLKFLNKEIDKNM
jgi:hypothetical protein